MQFSIDIQPFLPWPLIAGLAAIAGVAVLAALGRGVRGAFVRLVASMLLMLALLNPVLMREDRERLPGVVAIVTDESASQGLAARRTETAAAVAALKERIAALGGFTVREVRAGDSRAGEGTRLFDVLARAIDDVPPDQVSGAILVTDGQVHDVPPEPGALGFSAPLHALVTGRDGERDRRIEITEAPRFAILNEPQTIRFRVLDTGLANGTPITVTLKIDGKPVGRAEASVGQPGTIDLPIDHAGRLVAELEVPAVDGELTTANNTAVAEIDVVREHLRVLLVSGEPHAGERTWRDVLKSDSAVDLVHFTILRPPEKQDGTPTFELSLIAFPTRELFDEKIDEFDLIIFDRYQRRGVLPVQYYDNIARYVENGGALLVASGAEFASPMSVFRSPMGTVLPAEPTGELTEQPYRAAISAVGQRHPVTRELPGADADPPAWSRWFRLVDSTVLDGAAVMTGPEEKPLLVLSREGEGRVALMLSDHAWLWARNFEGGGPYGTLLRRLVHWLMKEPELEEEALTARTSGPDLVVERQTLGETQPPVSIVSPTGQPEAVTFTQVKPGLWQGILRDAPLGLHRAESGDLVALAHVGPANPREFQDVVSTAETLRPIATATGGAAVRIAASGAVAVPRINSVSSRSPAAGDGWIGLRRSEATVLRDVDRVPLLSGLLGLLLLVGAFAALWWREGR